MDLVTIRGEVQARGQDHVSTTLLDRWINRAYQDVCDRFPWPFLEVTVTGTAPLTISDLAHALSVLDTTNDAVLEWDDPRTIIERDADLTTTGLPDSWYYEGTALKVYPVNTSAQLSVRYIKIPTDLVADGDTPLLPTRFHYLLVQGACVWAYERAQDRDAAADYEQRYENGIANMAAALLVPNYDSPATIASPVSGDASSDW